MVFSGKEPTVGQLGKFDVIVKNRGVARGVPETFSAFVDNVLLEGNRKIETPRALWPGEQMVIGWTMPIAMAYTGKSKFEFFC